MFKDDPEGGPAFPTIELRTADTNDIVQPARQGMSLRDYFAAAAMQGLLAQSSGTAMSSPVMIGAQYAYEMADAMLKARNPDNG